MSLGDVANYLGAGGSAVVAAWAAFTNGKVRRLQTAQEECEATNGRLRRDLQANDVKTHTLESQVANLEGKLLVHEKAQGKFPLPFWITDEDGTFKFVSFEALRRIFAPLHLKEREVIGQHETAVWHSTATSAIFKDLAIRATESETKTASAYNVRIDPRLPTLNILKECRESIYSGESIMFYTTMMPADPRLAQMAQGIVPVQIAPDTGDRRRSDDSRTD